MEILRKLSEFVQAHRRQKKRRTKKSSTHSLLRKCQHPARQRFPGGIGRHEREKLSARPRRRERSRRRSRRCCQKQGKERKKKVLSSTPCGNGALVDHHSAPSSVWQDDVKASVVNAWQMSPFNNFLVGVPSCLTELSVFRIADPQGRTEKRGSP